MKDPDWSTDSPLRICHLQTTWPSGFLQRPDCDPSSTTTRSGRATRRIPVTFPRWALRSRTHGHPEKTYTKQVSASVEPHMLQVKYNSVWEALRPQIANKILKLIPPPFFNKWSLNKSSCLIYLSKSGGQTKYYVSCFILCEVCSRAVNWFK